MMASYGNFYAVELEEALGVGGARGGLLRVGFMHYNTIQEVERLLHALKEATASCKKP